MTVYRASRTGEFVMVPVGLLEEPAARIATELDAATGAGMPAVVVQEALADWLVAQLEANVAALGLADVDGHFYDFLTQRKKAYEWRQRPEIRAADQAAQQLNELLK